MPDIFYNALGNGLTLSGYLLCTAVSLAIGAIIAFVYTRRGSYTPVSYTHLTLPTT